MNNDSNPRMARFADSSPRLPTSISGKRRGRKISDPSGIPAAERTTTVTLPGDALLRLREQGVRLERSLNFLIAQCVKLSLSEIEAMPALNDERLGASDDDQV
jgi:hypothetical protein